MTRETLIAAMEAEPHEEAHRLVFADWCEENGEIELSKALRGDGVILLRPVIDTPLGELQDSYDWKEVFGEGGGGNTDKGTDPIPPDSDVDLTPPNLADVIEVVASSVERGDYAETDCLGVFRLKDGRYLVASGSCDTTGWD